MLQHGFPGLPGRPYSSMSGGYIGPGPHHHSDPFGLDNSQSYLGMDGGLQDTAIGQAHPGALYGDMEGDAARARLLASHRFVCVMSGE